MTHASSATTPAVSVEQVTRRFSEVTALDGLSFRVRPGELYGLVGPDGAGKTTAIRVIAGLMLPDTGVARVFGEAPTRACVRERLGLMPQQFSLYRDLSVRENLEFFARLNALPRRVFAERAERLLGITRLAPFLERRADALSGGMYKKLALACALLHQPEVLLLDEPTNGVDPVSRRELWVLLHEFVESGMAVLISTPYMDEAERCHRVGLLVRGRLLLEGEPQALLRGFEQEAYEVMGQDREGVEAALSGQAWVDSLSPAGARLRVVTAARARADLDAVLEPLGAHAVPVAPTFEDVYLARLAREAA
jgi:ABC-2 type transport system ATP-binding protein